MDKTLVKAVKSRGVATRAEETSRRGKNRGEVFLCVGGGETEIPPQRKKERNGKMGKLN